MKRGKEREGSGETIYPKFASSRSATGYTLICPLGNLSTPNAQPLLLASSWPSTSFPATPSTPIPTNPILPLSLFLSSAPFSRSAKPRSLTGILNTGDSSVFFSATLIPFPPPINIHCASLSFSPFLPSLSLPPSSPFLFPSIPSFFPSRFSCIPSTRVETPVHFPCRQCKENIQISRSLSSPTRENRSKRGDCDVVFVEREEGRGGGIASTLTRPSDKGLRVLQRGTYALVIL